MLRQVLILAVLLAGACKKSEPEAPAKGSAATVAVTGAKPPLVQKDHFRIDVGPATPCSVGAACEARVVLTALGGYHVNERYPFKLEADAAPGLAVDGTGSWVLDDAKTGTLTVKYKAAKPGTSKLSGTFKLSVCTDENCAIESPKIALDVNATN